MKVLRRLLVRIRFEPNQSGLEGLRPSFSFERCRRRRRQLLVIGDWPSDNEYYLAGYRTGLQPLTSSMERQRACSTGWSCPPATPAPPVNSWRFALSPCRS